MIDLNACNEWQSRDPETGLVFPWYTKSFLDELVTWDLADKVVFEYGAGASTLWWAKKSLKVYSIDSSSEWIGAIKKELIKSWTPGWFKFVGEKETYINSIRDCDIKYDIVIIDGEPIAWRDDCVKPALDRLKPGGRLIIDNWQQSSVGWLPSEETQQLLSQYPVKVYPQEGHPDWKTAVWTI